MLNVVAPYQCRLDYSQLSLKQISVKFFPNFCLFG
jgi:hypothetical protein